MPWKESSEHHTKYAQQLSKPYSIWCAFFSLGNGWWEAKSSCKVKGPRSGLKSQKQFSTCIILEESAQKTIRLSIRTSSREPEDRRLYLELSEVVRIERGRNFLFSLATPKIIQ
jgi:hypothetical protein